MSGSFRGNAGPLPHLMCPICNTRGKSWYSVVLMGCICSKGISTDEDGEIQQNDLSNSLKRFVTLSKEEVVSAVVEVFVGNDGCTTRPRPKPQDNGVSPALRMPDEEEKKAMVNVDRTRKAVQHQRRATMDVGENGSSKVGGDDEEPNLVIVDVPNGFSGEHEAAGWPSWLTSVAGEAVKGWLPRRANSFEKLDKVCCLHFINVFSYYFPGYVSPDLLFGCLLFFLSYSLHVLEKNKRSYPCKLQLLFYTLIVLF